MQSVSNDWIAAHEQDLLPEAFLRVRYLLSDEDAATTVTITDNGHSGAHSGAQAFDETDGVGYESSVTSGAGGIFATPPEITFSWMNNIAAPLSGITLDFGDSGEYATEFDVKFYLGAMLIDTVSVSGNTETFCPVLCEIGGFNKIVISISAWSVESEPAKIKQIYLGYMLTFDKTTIITADFSSSGDLLSLRLPQKNFDFEVDNVNGRLSPGSVGSLYDYIHPRQRVYTEMGYKLQSIIDSKIVSLNNSADTSLNVTPFVAGIVHRTGVNVWDGTYEIGTISASTGQNTSGSATRSVGYISVKPGESYCLSNTAGYNFRYFTYRADKSFITRSGAINTTTVLTIPDNVFYLRLQIGTTSYGEDLSVNYPSTETAYHAYEGSTANASLGDVVQFESLTGHNNIWSELGNINLSIAEWISGGQFFIKDWDIEINSITAKFSAVGITDLLDTDYTFPDTGTSTPYQLALNVLQASTIPTFYGGAPMYDIGAINNTDTIYCSEIGELNCTCAEALQYVANYECMVMFLDRTGILRIAPITTLPSNYWINRNNTWEKSSNVSITDNLKSVKVQYTLTGRMHTVSYSPIGEEQIIQNPVIYGYGAVTTRAAAVGTWAGDVLSRRKLISGEYRADPRLDVFDLIMNEDKYGKYVAYITDTKFSFSGAFRGSYEGRVHSVYNLQRFIPSGSDGLITADNLDFYCRESV